MSSGGDPIPNSTHSDAQHENPIPLERESKYLVFEIPLGFNLATFKSQRIEQGYLPKGSSIILIKNVDGCAEIISTSGVSANGTGELKRVVFENEDEYEKLWSAAGQGGYSRYMPDDYTFRVRRKGDKFFQTLKWKDINNSEASSTRPELEVEITEAQYDEISQLREGHLIKKDRYMLYKTDQVEVTLDIFDEPFASLIFVEIETKDGSDPQTAAIPDWITKMLEMAAINVSNIEGFSNRDLSRMDTRDLQKLLAKII